MSLWEIILINFKMLRFKLIYFCNISVILQIFPVERPTDAKLEASKGTKIEMFIV